LKAEKHIVMWEKKRLLDELPRVGEKTAAG